MLSYYREIILTEMIIMLGFWWWSPYIAFLLTCILTPVCLAVYAVSRIADKIEVSGIEKEYYKLMLGLAAAPVLLLIVVWLAGDRAIAF
jgi:hypothetical protein